MEAVSISVDERMMAAVDGASLKTWDLSSGKLLTHSSEEQLRKSVTTFEFETQCPAVLRSVCFTVDGRLLLAGSKGQRGLGGEDEPRVCLDDLTNRQIVDQFVPWGDYPDRPGPVAIRRDGKLLAYQCEEETATDCWECAVYVGGSLWDEMFGPNAIRENDIPDMKLRTTRTKALAFSTDGQWLLCGPEDGAIYLISLTQLLGVGRAELEQFLSVSGYGRYPLCLSTWTVPIHLLSVAEDANVRFALNQGPGFGVTGHRLLVSVEDRVALYSLGRTGAARIVAELGSIGYQVDALDLSVSGNIMACGSGEGVAVWNLATGKVVFATDNKFPELCGVQ
jgi:WD40 repeat protein